MSQENVDVVRPSGEPPNHREGSPVSSSSVKPLRSGPRGIARLATLPAGGTTGVVGAPVPVARPAQHQIVGFRRTAVQLRCACLATCAAVTRRVLRPHMCRPVVRVAEVPWLSRRNQRSAAPAGHQARANITADPLPAASGACSGADISPAGPRITNVPARQRPPAHRLPASQIFPMTGKVSRP